MSPGPADQVNAKELSARAAVLVRHLELAQLERVAEAGGLPGTRVDAQLRFGACEGQTTVEVRVEGKAVLECQRCLQPCECAVDETALVAVVHTETDDVPGGYLYVVREFDMGAAQNLLAARSNAAAYAANLEKLALPNADQVVAAVKSVCYV